jgi:hypothetical protein
MNGSHNLAAPHQSPVHLALVVSSDEGDCHRPLAACWMPSWCSLGTGYGLMPLPPQRWHRTTLSPFLRVPFPSQFLHFCFLASVFFCMSLSLCASALNAAGYTNFRRAPHPFWGDALRKVEAT